MSSDDTSKIIGIGGAAKAEIIRKQLGAFLNDWDTGDLTKPEPVVILAANKEEERPLDLTPPTEKPTPTAADLERYYGKSPNEWKETDTDFDKLPEDMQARIVATFNKLKKKYPHMKRHRILRKVGEELKIKFTW